MSQKYIGMFPGQGSQQVGMGKDFYESWGRAKEMFTEADDTLGFYLSKLCFEGPAEELVKTEYVQPAILVVSCIAFELARDKFGDGFLCAVAGHSLGEYSALVANGAIGFADAVKLVNKRGQYMQSAVPVGAGKMSAVIGAELADLEKILAQVKGIAEIANINAPGQIVISGQADSIDQAMQLLKDYRCVELPVSAPFHCSLMKPASEQLAKDLDQLNINSVTIPVFPNVLAEAIKDPNVIRTSLKDQVCGRVRWVECMQAMLAGYPGYKCMEFGAGGILSGLLRRIDRKAERVMLGTMEEFKAIVS